MTTSFEDFTAVVNALNIFMGMRNFEDPANKTRFLFTWIYNIFVLITNIAGQTLFAVHHSSILPNSVARFSFIGVSFIFAWSYAYTLILGWHHSKGILALRKKIAKVDESLRCLGLQTNYRHLFKRMMAILTFSLFYTALFAVLFVKWLLRQKIEFFTLIVGLCVVYEINVTAIVIHDFVTYIYWLDLRYRQTNELVKALFVDGHGIKTNVLKEYEIKPTRNHRRQALSSVKVYTSEYCFRRTRVFPLNEDPSSEHESQAAKKVRMLQTIRYLHMELDLIVKMVNEVFNAQLVTQTIVLVTFYTLTLYDIYNELTSSSTDVMKTIGRLGAHLLDVFNKTGNIVLACYSCECIMKEANKMKDIIHALSVKESDTELKDEILQFSLQLSLTHCKRSKSNMFHPNYTMLRTYASLVITYLIILIQYRPTLEVNESALSQNQSKYNAEFSFI